MRIQFDHANLLASVIGEEHGLTPSDLGGNEKAAAGALASFQKSVDEGIYGFPHLPFDTPLLKAIQGYARDQAGSFDTVCVVGIGGSALGLWALDCALRGPHPIQREHGPKFPRIVILDNVDPMFVETALASMKPKRTHVVVIAKSGATAETIATFLIVKEWLEQALGSRARQRITVVTSAGRGDLKLLATRESYATFHIPENVGGRFSVLSAVGLVPAALAGLNVGKICKGAAAITTQCWSRDLSENVALQAARMHHLVWTKKHKSIQVAFPYSNFLWGTAFWFRQLWAESLGKKHDRQGAVVHRGQTPVAALGTTDQHSQVQLYMEGPNDKVFTFWRIGKYSRPGKIPRGKSGLEGFDYLAGQTLAKLIDAEQRATAAALTEQQRPNCAFALSKVDEETVGAFLQLMMFETAFMGELLDVNAFDQEGVELGKKFTFALMGRLGFDEFGNRFQEYERKRGKAK
jgi:glucose-6-phosphate isomerase